MRIDTRLRKPLMQRSAFYIIKSYVMRRFSKTTLSGLTSTFIWQIANYIAPLLTVPYLTRTLGVTGYGILGVGLAMASYGLLLTRWGFEFSATQAVAQNRDNPEAISRILWQTVTAKVLLGLLSSAAIICGSLVLVTDELLKAVLLISTLAVVGEALNVEWVLRGMERFSSFAIASIIGRLSAIPLVFLLVRRSDQVPEAAFAASTAGLISAVIAWEMSRRIGILRKPRISIREVIVQLKIGARFFLSMAAVNLYTSSITVILGSISGAHEVGLFSSAEKIRQAVGGLLNPFVVFFYPRMSFLATTDHYRARSTSIVLLRTTAALSVILSAGLCLSAPLAIRVVLGEEFESATPVLRVMSCLIFLVSTNVVLANIIMIPFGLKREFTLCILVGTLVGLGSVFPLSYYAGAIGAAIALALAETAVMLALYLVLVRRLGWFRPLGRCVNADRG